MSTGSRVNVIAMQLDRLLQTIKNETLKLTSEGTVPNHESANYSTYFEQLQAWRQQLDLWQRQIKGMKSTLSMRSEAVRGLPRSIRFRENQSVNDRMHGIQGVELHAQEVVQALERLFLLSVTPTDLDLVNRSAQLIENQLDFFKELESVENALVKASQTGQITGQRTGEARTAIVEVRTRVQISRPQAQPLATDYMAMATVLLTLLRIWWLERIRQQR